MCTEAVVDGVRLEILGEFLAVMPAGAVYRVVYTHFNRPGYVPTREHLACCLCPVDFEATAGLNGFTVERDVRHGCAVFTREGA